jgi:hypothetical protein
MRRSEWIGGIGLAALLVAGCNKTAEQPNAAVTDNGSAFNEAAPLDNGSGGESAEAAPVDVAPVPAPAANLPAAEAAPLRQAAETASEIAAAADVERIPYDGGWAWRRNGQIIRTASRDGRRVSYFRPGQSNPYLVQDSGRAYAYSNGRVERSYDDRGRPTQVDAGRRDEGQRLARQSAQERDRARQVAARQPQRVQHERPGHGTDRNAANAPAPDRGKAAPPSNDRRDRASSDAGDRRRGEAKDRQRRGRDRSGGDR